jgi:hypothetical protein
MKVNIVGASAFVNRMFEACGQYQWAREFLTNAIEAGASRVQFGIEWEAVKKLGKYRRTIVDDGAGMDRGELLRFFSTLGEGAKKIGGVHENFGVGAKIASLPWNPTGVVVVSYKGGKGSMLRIVLNQGTGEYELVDWHLEGGAATCVVDPAEVQWSSEDVDWSALRPSWLKSHGTIVVLLGSERAPHTVLGNPAAEEGDIKGLSTFLNTRFVQLKDVDVTVTELRSVNEDKWPRGEDERNDLRRPNNRRIMGAQHYLTDVKAKGGGLADSGSVKLLGGHVEAKWFLWKGDRPNVASYAQEGGYIGIRYGNELYFTTSGKVPFRWFGIVEQDVQRRLTIVLEPQKLAAAGSWGVYPDQSRSRLLFTSGAQRGVEIPLVEWGAAFADVMPEAIREAIKAAREGSQGTIEDDEYRRRLQERFGNRWMMQTTIPSSRKSALRGFIEDDDVNAASVNEASNGKGPERGDDEGTTAIRVVSKRGHPGHGSDRLEAAKVPVDVPSYRFARKGDFEKAWHLASWCPHDPAGPTVLINLDSPILEEAVAYHVAQYPEVFAEEVAATVRKVFGEVAVAKVAHSQRLATEVPVEQLDREYRGEGPLTVALMGLIAEESLIGQRLRRLGQRKAVTA